MVENLERREEEKRGGGEGGLGGGRDRERWGGGWVAEIMERARRMTIMLFFYIYLRSLRYGYPTASGARGCAIQY